MTIQSIDTALYYISIPVVFAILLYIGLDVIRANILSYLQKCASVWVVLFILLIVLIELLHPTWQEEQVNPEAFVIATSIVFSWIILQFVLNLTLHIYNRYSTHGKH